MSTLCYAPTNALYRNPKGFLAPCCIYKMQTLEADLNKYLASQELKSTISDLSNGIYPDQCVVCNRDKELGRTVYADSFRFDSIRIDIRDRTCNLECLSCGDHSSTAHGAKTKRVFVNNKFNLPVIYDYIYNNKDKIKDAYFAGGEPFLSPITFKILELLNKDTKLHFSSNLTILKYKGIYVKEYLKEFNTINVMPSCDGINEVAEFTRKNLIFNEFVSNLDTFREFSKITSVWSVLSVPSILTFNEQVDFWKSKGLDVEFHIMEGYNEDYPINVSNYSNDLFADHSYLHKSHIESLPKIKIDRNKVSLNFLNSWPSSIKKAKKYLLYRD
jgi:organic radical activating enzyme